jgi:hypothetical protein
MRKSPRAQKHKGGKKNRKHGRQKKKPAQKRYTAERRWIKNKAKKIRKYMRTHPNWKPHNVREEVKNLI